MFRLDLRAEYTFVLLFDLAFSLMVPYYLWLITERMPAAALIWFCKLEDSVVRRVIWRVGMGMP